MKKLERHPLSAIFPDMPENQFNELKKDIEKHGQQLEGVVFEGKILDGYHRYLITKEKFIYKEFKGTFSEAIRHVTSANLYRRHLSDNQRMCLAAEICQILKATSRPGTNQFSDRKKLLKKGETGRVDIAMAKTLNVAAGSIGRAIYLKKNDPPAFERCKRGELSVTKAFTELKRAQAGAITVEDIKFPDSFSHYAEIERFLKQIASYGWGCRIVSVDGRFEAKFERGMKPIQNGEYNITRAIVTAVHPMAGEILKTIKENKTQQVAA